MSEKIEVENVNHPGHVTRVDAQKYRAAKTALLSVLPVQNPGLTQAEMLAAVAAVIDQQLFLAAVSQAGGPKRFSLDLEAKGKIHRVIGKPLRWIQHA